MNVCIGFRSTLCRSPLSLSLVPSLSSPPPLLSPPPPPSSGYFGVSTRVIRPPRSPLVFKDFLVTVGSFLARPATICFRFFDRSTCIPVHTLLLLVFVDNFFIDCPSRRKKRERFIEEINLSEHSPLCQLA